MPGAPQKSAGTALSALKDKFSTVLTPPNWASQLYGVENLDLLREPLRELNEAVETVDRFERRWQQEALFFLLGGFLVVCSLWEVYELAAFEREEVDEIVLFALEEVVRDGEFVATLREAVKHAPFIGDSQRVNLDHGLEHAAEGEYIKASLPLYGGLEGAFWEVGYAKAVVTLHRKDVRNTNKDIRFESMVKRLSIEQAFKTFMTRAVYGTVGNPIRHGGRGGGERRQVLLGVAALAGWFEEFTGVRALTALVNRTGQALPGAIELMRSGPRLLGP